MPKLIEDIKNKLIKAAKNKLLTEGYNSLSLRNVANECGIAVGTIYNYFPSKDILVATVISEDWLYSLDSMKSDCKKVDNLIDGFSVIYNTITSFAEVYSSVWSDYSLSGKPQNSFYRFHKLLRSQLVSVIKDLLDKYNKCMDDAMIIFIAESILTVAMQDDMDFEILSEVIRKIIN